MNANNNEWQTAKTIADDLGVTPSAITYAERNNGLVAGQHVESRLVTLADRARLDLTPQSRRLYRLVPRGATETVDDLLAELAGCEAHIEEIEAQNVDLNNRYDDFVRAAQNSISLADHRRALEEKDRAIQTLRDERRELKASIADAMAESEKWKDKADREGKALWRAEYVRDEYAELLADARGANIRAYEMGKREASEQQRLRNIVRRVVRRALEVVR